MRAGAARVLLIVAAAAAGACSASELGSGLEDSFSVAVVWDQSLLSARSQAHGAGPTPTAAALVPSANIIAFKSATHNSLYAVDVHSGLTEVLAAEFPTTPSWGPAAIENVLFSTAVTPPLDMAAGTTSMHADGSGANHSDTASLTGEGNSALGDGSRGGATATSAAVRPPTSSSTDAGAGNTDSAASAFVPQNLTVTAFDVALRSFTWEVVLPLPQPPAACAVFPWAAAAVSLVNTVLGFLVVTASTCTAATPDECCAYHTLAFDAMIGEVLWTDGRGFATRLARPLPQGNAALWSSPSPDLAGVARLQRFANVSRNGIDVGPPLPAVVTATVREAGTLLIAADVDSGSYKALDALSPGYDVLWSLADRGFLAKFPEGARLDVSEDAATVCMVRLAVNLLNFEMVCVAAATGGLVLLAPLPEVQPKAVRIMDGVVAILVDDLRIYNLTTGRAEVTMSIPQPDGAPYHLARLDRNVYSLSWGARWIAVGLGWRAGDAPPDLLPPPEPARGRSAAWGSPLLLTSQYIPPGLAVKRITCELVNAWGAAEGDVAPSSSPQLQRTEVRNTNATDEDTTGGGGGSGRRRHAAPFMGVTPTGGDASQNTTPILTTRGEWLNMTACACYLPAAAPNVGGVDDVLHARVRVAVATATGPPLVSGYSADIVISTTHRRAAPISAWLYALWITSGGVALMVFLALAAVYRNKRRRRGYQPVVLPPRHRSVSVCV